MSGYDGGLKNICVQVGVLRSDKNVFNKLDFVQYFV